MDKCRPQNHSSRTRYQQAAEQYLVIYGFPRSWTLALVALGVCKRELGPGPCFPAPALGTQPFLVLNRNLFILSIYHSLVVGLGPDLEVRGKEVGLGYFCRAFQKALHHAGIWRRRVWGMTLAALGNSSLVLASVSLLEGMLWAGWNI